MQIAITTVDRGAVNYVADTLASLHATGRWFVELFVGSPVCQYLVPLLEAGADAIAIKALPLVAWEVMKRYPEARHRASVNRVRALRSDYCDLLLCEDDIAFAPGWALALELACMANPGAIVGLYSPLAYADPDGLGWVDVGMPPPRTQYGITLAMYMPKEHRAPLASFIEARVTGAGTDDLVLKYAAVTGTRIIITVPSYVDHRGDVSSIPENADHGPRRSPMF